MSVLDEPFYTVPEVAGMFRISVGTVYSKLKVWPHTRITPTDVRFSEENIRDIIGQSTKTAPAPDTKRAPRVGTRARRNK